MALEKDRRTVIQRTNNIIETGNNSLKKELFPVSIITTIKKINYKKFHSLEPYLIIAIL